MRLIAILLLESFLILANPLNEKKEWMDSDKMNSKKIRMWNKSREVLVDNCPVVCEDSSGTKFCCMEDSAKACCTENKQCCRRLNPDEQLTEDVNGNKADSKKPQEEIVLEQITVLALAVGEGDCTLIKCPNNKLVIIDMGSSSGDSVQILHDKDVNKILIFYLDSYPSSKFRIIITHPDEDHYNYLIGALYGLESSVEYFILAGDLDQYDSIYANWFSKDFPNRIFSINGGSPCYGSEDCKIVPFGKSSPVITPNFCNDDLVKFTILAANLGSIKNSKSVAMKMQYGTISLLFPGDFASNVSQNLIINHYNSTGALSATIYKMAHHGSATQANNFDFLNQIKPKAAFASQAYPTNTNSAFPRCTVVDDLVKLGIEKNVRSYPFACGNSGQQPKVYPQWNYQIYETCRQQPYNMCYNIKILLNQTDYVIGYLPETTVKSSDEGMNV